MSRTAYHYADALTTQRDRREQNAAEAYNAAYELEADRQQLEWEAEFDTIPYVPNGLAIHFAVVERLRNRV